MTDTPLPHGYILEPTLDLRDRHRHTMTRIPGSDIGWVCTCGDYQQAGPYTNYLSDRQLRHSWLYHVHLEEMHRPPEDTPLTPQEAIAAGHLLGYYDHPNHPKAGSFTTTLIRCLECADPSNKRRLLSAFPEYQKPVLILSTKGIDALAEAAAG